MADKEVRLIDKDKLIEKINAEIDAWGKARMCMTANELLETIEEFEEDAEPVKHGRWELISQNKFTGTKTLRCTYCKNYFVVRDDTLNAGRGDANFCPNCGSKQDLGGDSDDEP